MVQATGLDVLVRLKDIRQSVAVEVSEVEVVRDVVPADRNRLQARHPLRDSRGRALVRAWGSYGRRVAPPEQQVLVPVAVEVSRLHHGRAARARHRRDLDERAPDVVVDEVARPSPGPSQSRVEVAVPVSVPIEEMERMEDAARRCEWNRRGSRREEAVAVVQSGADRFPLMDQANDVGVAVAIEVADLLASREGDTVHVSADPGQAAIPGVHELDGPRPPIEEEVPVEIAVEILGHVPAPSADEKEVAPGLRRGTDRSRRTHEVHRHPSPRARLGRQDRRCRRRSGRRSRSPRLLSPWPWSPEEEVTGGIQDDVHSRPSGGAIADEEVRKGIAVEIAGFQPPDRTGRRRPDGSGQKREGPGVVHCDHEAEQSVEIAVPVEVLEDRGGPEWNRGKGGRRSGHERSARVQPEMGGSWRVPPRITSRDRCDQEVAIAVGVHVAGREGPCVLRNARKSTGRSRERQCAQVVFDPNGARNDRGIDGMRRREGCRCSGRRSRGRRQGT